MPNASFPCRRLLMPLLFTAGCAAALLPAPARGQGAGGAPPAGSAPASEAQPSAMVSLISRLAERGSLTKQDAAELTARANADAADVRVQAAEALLAAAKADAAVARAQAAAMQAASAMARAQEAAGQATAARGAIAQFSAAQIAAARMVLGLPPAASAAPMAAAPAEVPPTAGSPSSAASQPVAAPPIVTSSPGPGRVAPVELPAVPNGPPAGPDSLPAAAVAAAPGASPPTDDRSLRISDVLGETVPATSAGSVRARPVAPNSGLPGGAGAQTALVSDVLGETPPPAAPPTVDEGASAPASAAETQSQAAPAEAPAQAGGGPPARAEDIAAGSEFAGVPESETAASAPPPDGIVRVPYIPQVAKNQIRDEVRDEVLAEARKEGWGQKQPGWVSRLDVFGDIRVRFESIINHSGNDNTGAFPNFNAINTGSPFDVSNLSSSNFYPTYDVDQDRKRARLRARFGAGVDLTSGFTAEFRLATGNDNNPVTENQTFGAAGGAQGGNFSKYSVWLDRGFIKYQTGGDPSRNLSLRFGRFDNPFFEPTTLIWADDIGFDGVAAVIPAQVHVNGEVVDTVKPFIVAGMFPVFNTDLNFASNQPAKFSSYDKWLEAAQIGVGWNLGRNFSLKSAAALYNYKNIEGQVSSPFTPLAQGDAGNTDASRPSFAQYGNTYMELRNIRPIAGTAAQGGNQNGTIDQWQYYGLATPFRVLAINQEIAFTHFEPFRVSLSGEWVKNLAFDPKAIAALAINNVGPAPAVGKPQPFIGGNEGWIANLKLGSVLHDRGGQWGFALGYRKLESDAAVDGFTDADFGGSLLGTNLKGFTLSANVTFAPGVWLEGRWYSATAVAGPTFRNDMLQIDLNGKF